MPDASRRQKLNEIQRGFVKRCLASGFGPCVTAEFVKDEFGVEISPQNVDYYRRQYTDEIAALREQLSRDILAIPFANKLNRVALLDKLVGKHLKSRRWTELRAVLKELREEVDAVTVPDDQADSSFIDALSATATQVWTGQANGEDPGDRTDSGEDQADDIGASGVEL